MRGQSLRKLERRAINRTHLTFVNGDTVQRFTVTYARPAARFNRFYYWQGPTQILRTAGAYNGRLLTGDYQLTSRNGNLLGSGSFHKGLKTGLWRTWRPDGTPMSSSHWREGRQRGRTQYYDETGQLLRSAPVSSPGAAAPAATHFWQPATWRVALKRRKLRRQERRQAKAAAPVSAPDPKAAKAPKKSKKPKATKPTDKPVDKQPSQPAVPLPVPAAPVPPAPRPGS